MPKVSVIVPVFRVEKYIERCARSLFEQTLDDIEIIFIDDCTPDRSIEILESVIDEYSKRIAQDNKKVRIERMPINSGQAEVRKAGVQYATGDYIIYCDSDDWTNPDMYREMYGHAIDSHSDLVFCDYIISNGNRNSEKVFKKDIRDCSRHALLERLLTSYDLNPVWSVMTKKELYNDMIYPVGAMSEDKTMTIQLAWKANNASYLPKALYYYFLSDDSTTRTVSKEAYIRNFRQIADNRMIVLEFFDREKLEIPKKQLVAFLFAAKVGLIESFPDDPECKRLWNDTFPMSVWSVLFNPYIDFKLRIRYFVISLSR